MYVYFETLGSKISSPLGPLGLRIQGFRGLGILHSPSTQNKLRLKNPKIGAIGHMGTKHSERCFEESVFYISLQAYTT